MPTDDPETAAIIHGWQEYWRVYEKFAADPSGFTDFTETQYVTTGEESDLILDRIATLRHRNLKVEGAQRFRDVSVDEIRETLDGLRTTGVSYCADNSERRLIDAATGEVVPRKGGDTYRETASMVEGLDGIWRVASMENEESSC